MLDNDKVLMSNIIAAIALVLVISLTVTAGAAGQWLGIITAAAIVAMIVKINS